MRIVRTALRALLVLLVVGAGLVTILVMMNPAPDVSPADAGDAARPYVIKLHAQWCVVCMVTKDEWATVQEAYADKANLVVFDFTTDATTERSRAQAQVLGLTSAFDEFNGATGLVLVLDGQSREIRHVLDGSRDVADYRAAIDDVLSAAAAR